MPKKKIVEIDQEITSDAPVTIGKSELEQLRELYQNMRDRGFNSIGDIENKIARLQN